MKTLLLFSLLFLRRSRLNEFHDWTAKREDAELAFGTLTLVMHPYPSLSPTKPLKWSLRLSCTIFRVVPSL